VIKCNSEICKWVAIRRAEPKVLYDNSASRRMQQVADNGKLQYTHVVSKVRCTWIAIF